MMTGARTFSVTSEDAARQLGVHGETLRRWARAGRIPARKTISGKWVFEQETLDSLDVHAVIEQEGE